MSLTSGHVALSLVYVCLYTDKRVKAELRHGSKSAIPLTWLLNYPNIDTVRTLKVMLMYVTDIVRRNGNTWECTGRSHKVCAVNLIL